MKPSQRVRHLLARGLFALLLLFAQQTASLHWLSHAVDAVHAKASKGSAPTEHCDECLAIGALGAAATATPFAFVGPAGHRFWEATRQGTASPLPLRLAFRSRAPPVRV